MRVDGAGSVEIGAGTSTAANGLVVLVGIVAEGEIIHRALRGCHLAHRAEERVGDDLAGLDIAGHHGRGPFRRQHGVRGNKKFDRLEAAII